MFKRLFIYLLLPGTLLFAEEETEEKYTELELTEKQSSSTQYNPLCRYYPYNRIFQASYIRESIDNEPSWPGKRDGDFLDELTR